MNVGDHEMANIWTFRIFLLSLIGLCILCILNFPRFQRQKYIPRYRLAAVHGYSMQTLFGDPVNDTDKINQRSATNRRAISTGGKTLRNTHRGKWTRHRRGRRIATLR